MALPHNPGRKHWQACLAWGPQGSETERGISKVTLTTSGGGSRGRQISLLSARTSLSLRVQYSGFAEPPGRGVYSKHLSPFRMKLQYEAHAAGPGRRLLLGRDEGRDRSSGLRQREGTSLGG